MHAWRTQIYSYAQLHFLHHARTSGSSCLTDAVVGSGDWWLLCGVWHIGSPGHRDIEVDKVDCSVRGLC